MNTRALLLAVIALAALSFTGTVAHAELSCSASVSQSLVAFGTITVRDGVANQTTGTLNYSCSGGTADAVVTVCLSLGAGDGGAAAGYSPRYMKRSDGALLAYELRSDSQAGNSWTTVAKTVTLDASGAASFTDTIYAEVTAPPSEAKAGSYASTFSGADSVLSFGEGSGLAACASSADGPAFSVTATVAASCILAVSPLDFGSITSLAQNVDAATTITANCTTAVPYSISLGLKAGETASTRSMAKGGDTISYGLYQNAARSIPWGNTVNDDYDGTGIGATQNIPVYGRIPAQPMPPSAGTYRDTVVVTITY